MVVTRTQNAAGINPTERSIMERYSDSESEASVHDRLSRDQIIEFDYGVINRRENNEQNSIDQYS